MALTPHRDVHPVRRAIGLLMLLGAVVALFAATWDEHRAADQIEHAVRTWMEQSGRPPSQP